MKRWICLFLVFGLAAFGCGGKETEAKPLPDILAQPEQSEDGTEYTYPLLPWGSTREEAMAIQGFGEDDLEDISGSPDSETDTLTKRLPVDGLDAEVRILNNWYGEGRLGAFSYYFFFETEEAAEDFFAELFDQYEEAFPGQVNVMTDGDREQEFQLAVQAEVVLGEAIPPTSHIWVINAQESGTVTLPYVGQQEAGEYVVYVEAMRDPEKIS